MERASAVKSAADSTATAPFLIQEPPDFSLVLGGPIFQLLRRSHLSGDGLELLHRRILFFTTLAWLPLLLLALIFRNASDAARLSFFHDIEAHVRLLVALPILIAAELVVHRRIRAVVKGFLSRRIVRTEDMPKFVAALDSAVRLRNSIPVELGLLFIVFTFGQWLWRSQAVHGSATWYAATQNGHLQLTIPGYWYVFVSIPVFQFIVLRWYFRFFIWFRFLWHVSRLDLHLIPTHPDRAGGLGFVGKSSYAFGPILFAQGALLSGLIASRVLYAGQDLLSFKMEAAGFIVFFLVAILAPLLMFTPQLAQAKRQGLAEYGVLSSHYVEGFESKWVKGQQAEGELLGSGDIQSLADLGNSYAVVREMRPIAFDMQDIARLAAATAAPLVPLGLLVFSFEELVVRIFKIVF